MHTLSYTLQQSLSVLLVIAVVIVICLGPWRICPEDPGQIGTLAAALSQSCDLRQQLQELGSAGHKYLRRELDSFSYRARYCDRLRKITILLHVKLNALNTPRTPLSNSTLHVEPLMLDQHIHFRLDRMLFSGVHLLGLSLLAQ
jgi:hypothetical protein